MNTKPFNKLTPAQAERLALIAEEAGEVVQIIGKILRHGYESHHPSGMDTNRHLLEVEIGDLNTAVAIAVSGGDLNDDRIMEAAKVKLGNVMKWLHHQNPREMPLGNGHDGDGQ